MKISGKTHAVFLSLGMLFTVGMSVSILGPSLPYFINKLGVGISDLGILFMIKPCGFIGGLLAARYLIKSPLNMVGLRIGMGLYAVMAILIPHQNSLAGISTLFFVLAFVEGIFESYGNTFILKEFGNKAGAWMNSIHFIFGVGTIIVPFMIGIEEGYLGTIYLVYAGMGSICLIVLILSIGYKINLSEEAEEVPAEKGKNLIIPLIVGAVFFFYVGAEAVFSTFIYNFSVDHVMTDPLLAGSINSLFWIGLTVGRMISIVISGRNGILFSVFTFSTLLTLAGVLFANNLNALILPFFSFLVGVGLSSVFPEMLLFASNVMKAGRPNQITLYLISAAAGALIFPRIVGSFYDQNPLIFFTAVFLCNLLTLILFIVLWLIRPPKNDLVKPIIVHGY